MKGGIVAPWDETNQANGSTNNGGVVASESPIRLGSMTLADVLDNTFRIVRANWKSMGTICLWFFVPLGILEAIIYQGTTTEVDGVVRHTVGMFQFEPNSIDRTAFASALSMIEQVILPFVAFPVMTIMVTRIAAASVLGKKISIRMSLKNCKSLYLRLLVAGVLIGIALICGFILLVIPAIYLIVKFSLAFPVMIIEDIGVSDGIGRSFALTANRFWRYLLIYAVTFLLMGLFFAVVAYAPLYLADAMGSSGLDPLAWVLIVASLVLQGFVAIPLANLVPVMVYFDSRVRHEGLDVQLMASTMQEPVSTSEHVERSGDDDRGPIA